MNLLESQAYPTIIGVGGCLGDVQLDNDALLKKYPALETNSQEIINRTGIVTRYHTSKGVLPSHLGIQAARLALQRANQDPAQINYFNVSNTIGDHISPSVATLMHEELGLHEQTAGVVDIGAACAGAVAAYEATCAHMMGFEKPLALTVSTETLSHGINPQDRSTAVLFGDGAGAVVMQRQPGAHKPVFSTLTTTDPKAVNVRAGIATGFEGLADERFIRMEGKKVRAHAATMLVRVAEMAARRAGIWDIKTNQIDPRQLGLFVPHQANYTMIEPLADALGIPEEKRVKTVMHHGNTSSASIPLALNEAYESGQLPRNERIRILMPTIGAGMVAKAAVIDIMIADERSLV